MGGEKICVSFNFPEYKSQRKLEIQKAIPKICMSKFNVKMNPLMKNVEPRLTFCKIA